MKKVISLLISLVMAVSSLSVGAYAAVNRTGGGTAMPMYESSFSVRSSLSAKDKTAECKSAVILTGGEKWISITQTLEKQSSNGTWSSTSYTWTKNADNGEKSYIFTNTATVSESGKYRVKSSVVFKTSDGKSETATAYSGTVSI